MKFIWTACLLYSRTLNHWNCSPLTTLKTPNQLSAFAAGHFWKSSSEAQPTWRGPLLNGCVEVSATWAFPYVIASENLADTTWSWAWQVQLCPFNVLLHWITFGNNGQRELAVMNNSNCLGDGQSLVVGCCSWVIVIYVRCRTCLWSLIPECLMTWSTPKL